MKTKCSKTSRMVCSMLLALLLSLALVYPGSASEVGKRDFETKMAPDFELDDLEGGSVKLSALRNEKAVLIYFWATWCPHCVSIQPNLTKLRREVSEQDLEILGINVGSGDSLERVKRFQERHPADWPILYDADSKVTRSYGVQGIPLFILVDLEGREVFRGNSFPEDPMAHTRQ